MTTPSFPYCIVTPAFNEEAYLARTIESVIAQTTLPLQWIIVDDGSTDNTAELIQGYAQKHPWIGYYRRQRDERQAYFASNVYAIMEGVAQLAGLAYDYLAILDADIELGPDYYEQIAHQFQADPKLGVASGVYENLIDGELVPVVNDRRSLPKALQVFRRECFETIGGYLPLQHGGEDTCSCVMSRMHGWKTWSYPEIKVVHLRPTGLGNAKSLIKAKYTQGLCEYCLGSHVLFILLKSVRLGLIQSPRVIGGMARFAGFMSGVLKRVPLEVPPDVVKFFRREQLGRVFLGNRIPKSYQVAGAQESAHQV